MKISGKTAGADLFVRASALPGPVLDDCGRGRHLGHRVETCTLRHPLPFTFFVGVYGASDFGGATLTLTYR